MEQNKPFVSMTGQIWFRWRMHFTAVRPMTTWYSFQDTKSKLYTLVLYTGLKILIASRHIQNMAWRKTNQHKSEYRLKLKISNISLKLHRPTCFSILSGHVCEYFPELSSNSGFATSEITYTTQSYMKNRKWRHGDICSDTLVLLSSRAVVWLIAKGSPSSFCDHLLQKYISNFSLYLQ